MSCKSDLEYFHESKVKDTKLAEKLTQLSRDGWEDIEFELDEDSGMYIVDANRPICMCLPNTPVQMMLLILEKIGDVDLAKKHWRMALRVYNA